MRIVGYLLGLLTLTVGLAASQTKTDTARKGDQASGIAQKQPVSQADLLRKNSLTGNSLLRIGMKLAVSRTPAPKGRTYTVKKGENDWIIAKRFKLTEHQLHLFNPSVDWKHLKPGCTLRVDPIGKAPTLVASHVSSKPAAKPKPAAKAKPASRGYLVRKGDNDWVIAIHAGISPKQLRVANPGVNWDRLQIGQALRIPGQGSQGTVVAKSTNSIRSRFAKINRDSVVVRRQPGKNADKVTVVESGLLVKVLDRDSGWYKLKFPKGTVGWVRGDMLVPAKKPVVVAENHSRRSSRSHTRVASRRSRRHHSTGLVAAATPAGAPSVIRKAYSRLGARYTWGRNDCSGFVMNVMKSQGVILPHSSRAQSGRGRRVSKGEIKAGDLVFFKTNRGTRINHVGIALGDGRFIHASSGGGKVQINSLNDGYYKGRFAGARRVLSQGSKKGSKKGSSKK